MNKKLIVLSALAALAVPALAEQAENLAARPMAVFGELKPAAAAIPVQVQNTESEKLNKEQALRVVGWTVGSVARKSPPVEKRKRGFLKNMGKALLSPIAAPYLAAKEGALTGAEYVDPDRQVDLHVQDGEKTHTMTIAEMNAPLTVAELGLGLLGAALGFLLGLIMIPVRFAKYAALAVADLASGEW